MEGLQKAPRVRNQGDRPHPMRSFAGDAKLTCVVESEAEEKLSSEERMPREKER